MLFELFVKTQTTAWVGKNVFTSHLTLHTSKLVLLKIMVGHIPQERHYPPKF